MQFDTDFRFDMDDNYGLGSQTISCPSTSTSYSSASSTYDPFTPSSRRSTPHELSLDIDGSCTNVMGSSQLMGITPTSAQATMPKYMFGPVKTESEAMSFNNHLPTTPMKKMQGIPSDYEHMLDMSMVTHQSIGSLTPSNSFGMYTISPETAIGPGSFMMTPSHSFQGSDLGDSSSAWSYADDSPISFFPHRILSSHEINALEFDRQSQSPFDAHQLHHGFSSPDRARHHRKIMVHDIQNKSTELQRAQIRESRKRSRKPESTPVDVVRRAMCKCDYPGCTKAFRRNEHLKRHKQTFHAEGPNKFSCEFCGKDQFNRQDNLNNHRKLHARPNSRNRGVEFIPAAVAIIEQEERSRKRRAPSKAKLAEKAGQDY